MRNQRKKGISDRTRPIQKHVCISREKQHEQQSGASIVIALIGASLLITAGIILVSNSHWFFKRALKSSDFKSAREVSEYGAAALTEELNTDGNSYLLIVQPACWQASTIDVTGIFMPAGTAPGPNKINGVISNSSPTNWKVVPLKTGQTESEALSSGSYARYQLTEYIPPQRPGSSTNYLFSDNCPSSSTAQFANRYGGSAFLTIRGELYRRGNLESEHTITQEVHVKGAMASSFGETSLVLSEGGELNTIKPYADLNNNNTKEDNEPWLDIFCVHCTGSTQTELKTADGPIGIGLQGVMANNYDGYIYTGKFRFPPFPFEDTDADGFQACSGAAYDSCSEAAYPQALYAALDSKARAASWSASPSAANGTITGGGSELSKKLVGPIPFYNSGTASSELGTISILFCATSGQGSNNKPCSNKVAGDIEQITIQNGSALTSAGTYYAKINEICSFGNISSSYAYCSAGSSISFNISSTTSSGFIPETMGVGNSFYPYTSSSKASLVNECANMTTYIGCVVSSITLQGGGNSSTTVIPTYGVDGSVIPVRIYITDTSLDANGDLDTKTKVVDLTGGQTLINSLGNEPTALRLYGTPPVANSAREDQSCKYKNQVIGIGGTGDVLGIWAWLPRGQIDAGSGTGILSGALWACDFQGNGNFSFLGSNQNITRGECGTNTPCGLYKYRAQGIAQVERL